jgi:ribonuclease HII
VIPSENNFKTFDKTSKEVQRFNEMCKFENEAYSSGIKLIAGIDEAGRGPLAGPVVAAAVILPENIFIEKLNDSKKLTPGVREQLYTIIMDKALAYSIGISDEKCIDEINILNATVKAMISAVNGLALKPDLLLIDAVKLNEVKIAQKPIIKGDCLSISIAAASILAKVTRDRFIVKMDSIYPEYGFSKHKGYGTKEHIDAIKKYGICPIHRISFTKNFLV